MKPRNILVTLAAIFAVFVQPALAELTHINGVPIPPVQTIEQARTETEKRLAAIKAREAEEAGTGLSDAGVFYTGKPYLESTGQYAFLFRNYDPGLSRWTSADPSRFPDGANNVAYLAVPTTQFDWQGLKTGLIAGLDITLRVFRSGSWVDITDGGDIFKSKDTRFELIIKNDPDNPQGMLDADKKPLGGYAVDKDPSGEISPALAS